jgi:hypothetical protein
MEQSVARFREARSRSPTDDSAAIHSRTGAPITRLLLPTLALLIACGDKTDTGVDPVDADSDGYLAEVDCDDDDPEVHPGADEICDGIDNNCDGFVDDADAIGAVAWYLDGDEDGFGDPEQSLLHCDQPSGYLAEAGDCDDGDPAQHPGADEYCNGEDDDCDELVDEGDALDVATWYQDADGDGYGDLDVTLLACDAPTGFVEDATDCDDEVASTYPGADEYCDGVDSDCDGTVDENDALDATTWYADGDGDGYGDAATAMVECYQPSGYGLDATDCDDADADQHPGADEYCSGEDDDCDGLVDEDDALDTVTWYADADSDGFGDSSSPQVQCYQPSGYVIDATDCDDAVGSTYPGAAEYCDGVDSDCDGTVDEDDALDVSTWYADSDSDGYGDAGSSDIDCSQPSGFVADATDCDDSQASVHPGASEATGDGVDSDCDGGEICYVDADDDGYRLSSTTTSSDADCSDSGEALASASTGDCDDGDASVNPGAAEVCDAANTDEDCDGYADDYDSSATGQSTWYRDADGDGYGTSSSVSWCDAPSGYVSASSDCDDSDAGINPGATESCDDVDEDCDGVVDNVSATATSCTATDASLVQCCIDSLGSSGGTVTLGWRGTSYFDETIDLRSNLTIDGVVTSSRPILQFDGSDEDDLMYGLDASDVTLANFHLYGTRTTSESYYCASSCSASDQHGIVFNRSSGRIHDITLDNVSVRYAHKHGLYIERADDVEIVDCNFRANGTSQAYHHNIYLLGCDGVLVENLGSRYSAGHGINLRGCHDVTVQDAEIKYNHHVGLRVAGCTTCSSYALSSSILLDNVIAHYNDSNGIEVREEYDSAGARYYAEDVCVRNSDMDGNGDYGLYFSYVDRYQRSSNSYSGNSSGDDSITNSTHDSTVCP